MDKIRKLLSFVTSKNETNQDSGGEVGCRRPEPRDEVVQASPPLFATTAFVESELNCDDLFEVGTFVEYHFGRNPPHKPKDQFQALLFQIDKLKEKLEREQIERATEAANHSGQVKAFQKTISEIQIEQDETKARLAELEDVSMTSKSEQMRIEQLEEKVGKFDVMFLEWYQQPQQPCRIPPHPGDAYRHNASDKKTRSSSDSSLGQGTTYLPPPISRVCRQTISNDSTSSHAIYGHAENGYSDGRDIEYVKATDRMLEEYAPILPHNRVADRDGITREIKKKVEELKKTPIGMPVADEVDEELWPYDPNLDCPHCGKRFRHGQIREFRYHIDDEHHPSLM